MLGLVRQLRSPNYVFLRHLSSSSLSNELKSDYSGIARESVGPIYRSNKNLENDVRIFTQSLIPFHTLRAVGEQLQPRAKVKWDAYVRETELAIKDAEQKLYNLLSLKKKSTNISNIFSWYDALMACMSLDQTLSPPPSSVEDLSDNSNYLGYKWSLRSPYKYSNGVHWTKLTDMVFEFFPETRDLDYKIPNNKLSKNITEMAELRAAMYQRRIQDEILQPKRVEEEYSKRSKHLPEELSATIEREMEKLPSSAKTSRKVDNISEATGMELVIEKCARNKMAELIFQFAIKNAKNQFSQVKENSMSPLIAYLEQLKTLYRQGTHSARLSLVNALLQYPPLQTLLYSSLEETRKQLETTADKDSATFFPPAVAAVMTEIDAIVTAGGKTLDYTEWRKALTNTDLYKPLVVENIPVKPETISALGDLDFLLGPVDDVFEMKETQDKNPNFFSQKPVSSHSLLYFSKKPSKVQNQSVLMERYAIINLARQQFLLLQVNKDLFNGIYLDDNGVPDGTDGNSAVEVRRYCIYKTINIPNDLLLKMKSISWPTNSAKKYRKLLVELDLVKWRADQEEEQKV